MAARRCVVVQAVCESRAIPSSCSFPVCCRGTSPPPPAAESTSGPVSRHVIIALTSRPHVPMTSPGRPARLGAHGGGRGGSAPARSTAAVGRPPAAKISGAATTGPGRALIGRAPSQIARRRLQRERPDDLTLSDGLLTSSTAAAHRRSDDTTTAALDTSWPVTDRGF